MVDAELKELESALADQYRFERELGRGGMGVVYLARDQRLERAVAIKILPATLAQRPELKERFLREARTAAQLSHPNIVPIYRADEAGGHAYFVMAYIDGESLAERVLTRGPMVPPEAVRYLREVAWALSYAHARGVIHRDVKPENIMIERGSGRALVTDFGIARLDVNPKLTEDGHVLGTVHYMSPEQVQGEALDGRSDLYALGVLGFYILSGRLPFEGLQPSAILVAHATRPAPPLSSVAPNVPRQLTAVIDRCLLKDRDARYGWEEFFDALTRAMSAADVEAASVGAGPQRTVSESEAASIWRRAAQLQAEAAQRLEQRARRPDTIASRAGETPSDGYRLRDVEAAAVEAGISQHFVALALAELPNRPQGVVADITPWQERAAARLLGSTQRSVSASRVIRATPRRVLQAVGRALQSAPYSLALGETIGGHPLDGGILTFELPDVQTTAAYPWLYTRYGAYAKRLQVTMHAIANDPGACEVVVYADLRQGVKANLLGSGAITAALATAGGAIGGAIGVKALAIAGLAVGLPAAGGAALLGVASIFGYGWVYRWGIRKVMMEFEHLLGAVENDVRSEELFGSLPPSQIRVADPQIIVI